MEKIIGCLLSRLRSPSRFIKEWRGLESARIELEHRIKEATNDIAKEAKKKTERAKARLKTDD